MKLSGVSMAVFVFVLMLGVKDSRQMLRRLMEARGPPKGLPRDPPRGPPRGPPKGPLKGPPRGPPTKPANRICNSTKMSYRMIFPERTVENYALMRNAINQNLSAVTLCSFVKDNVNDSSNGKQCAYSYAVPGQHNEFSFCTSPTLQVLINGTSRKTSVSIEDGKWHHICFTWESSTGQYRFFKDGKTEVIGSGFEKGYKIRAGGTLVLGQDQDKLAGDFDGEETFVGELSQINVWDQVLMRRAIVKQSKKCHITKGTINWWAQFRNSVHGRVQVIEK